MKTIINKKTQTTPEIIYDDSNKTINITGRTILLEPEKFWALNISTIKNISSKEIITLNLNFEYINTVSLRCLSKLIKIDNLNVNWICNDYDDDMIEIGELLSESTKHKMNFLNEIKSYAETGNIRDIELTVDSIRDIEKKSFEMKLDILKAKSV